ncbi:MAG TPA: hypothetical protein VIX17_18405, partial [Pyrinomonadaceae bacterium]
PPPSSSSLRLQTQQRQLNPSGHCSTGAAEDGRAPTEELSCFTRWDFCSTTAGSLPKLIGNRKSIAIHLIDLYFDFEPLLVNL